LLGKIKIKIKKNSIASNDRGCFLFTLLIAIFFLLKG